jgi:hypothetical protein
VNHRTVTTLDSTSFDGFGCTHHSIFTCMHVSLFFHEKRFLRYACKDLTSCSKFANKPSTSCVRTASVPSCQQVWNNLLICSCNNLVGIIRLVARLFQQVRCSLDITILLQPCVVNLVTCLLYHDCIRLVRTTL